MMIGVYIISAFASPEDLVPADIYVHSSSFRVYRDISSHSMFLEIEAFVCLELLNIVYPEAYHKLNISLLPPYLLVTQSKSKNI